jgi:hypothetical protein
MTPTEIKQLDDALTLYRREGDETACMSTLHYAATLYLGAVTEPLRREHYLIDGCIELVPPRDRGPWPLQLRPNMLFFHDLTVPMLDSLLAHVRGGTA